MADSLLLGAGSGPDRITPPQGPSRILDVSLGGVRVLRLQKAALSSNRTRISAAVSSVSVSSLPFITFPLPPFRLLPLNDPALEVQAGSCMSWPCIQLAESSEICLGKSCGFFFFVVWVFFFFNKKLHYSFIPQIAFPLIGQHLPARTVQACSNRQLICLAALTASSVSPLCGRCFVFPNFC